MKRVLTALVLIPIVLLVVFKAPDWLFALVAAMFGLIAAWEYLEIVGANNKIYKGFGITVVAIFFCGLIGLQLSHLPSAFEVPITVAISIAFGAPFLLLLIALQEADLATSIRASAITFFVFPYVAFPIACITMLRTLSYGAEWFFIILLFFVVWSGDIFAYYIGKSFGRHKLAPRISPGKSWEGAFASVIGASLIAVLLVQFSTEMQSWLAASGLVPAPTPGDPSSGIPTLSPAPVWITLLIAITLNVAAQLGDLAESMIKRGAGLKDSGTLFPGHGGVLDRIDALLFAAPLAAILFTSLQHYFFRNPR